MLAPWTRAAFGPDAGERAVLAGPRFIFAQLGFGQTRLAARPGPVREPGQAIRVAAGHPVARRPPVHAASPRRHQQPRMPIQHQGNRQNAPRLLGVNRAPRLLRESAACRIEPRLRQLGNPSKSQALEQLVLERVEGHRFWVSYLSRACKPRWHPPRDLLKAVPGPPPHADDLRKVVLAYVNRHSMCCHLTR